MEVQAVIFDMDGVLLDSEQIHYLAYCEALKFTGVELTLDWFRQNSPGIARVEVLRAFQLATGAEFDVQSVAKMKGEAVRGLLETNPAVIPEGVHETLMLLSKSLPLAVATASTMAEEFLTWAGLRSYFPVVVTSAQVAQGKPAPDIYEEAARLLNMSAKSSAVVEDSIAGIQAGQAAGAYVIGYSILNRIDALAEADVIADSFGAIGNLVRAA